MSDLRAQPGILVTVQPKVSLDTKDGCIAQSRLVHIVEEVADGKLRENDIIDSSKEFLLADWIELVSITILLQCLRGESQLMLMRIRNVQTSAKKLE